MKAFRYRMMYWFGMARWDTGRTPPELEEAFNTGDILPGPALDLGCGTGTNVIYMAKQGRQATGIDFVPEAIAKARVKAERAGVADRVEFFVADVTQLSDLNLPQVAFALDMGCFHGLRAEGQERYVEALAQILIPGGRYMLYTIDPVSPGNASFGISMDQVKQIFKPWFDIQHIERGTFRDRGSTWFWMARNQK